MDCRLRPSFPVEGIDERRGNVYILEVGKPFNGPVPSGKEMAVLRLTKYGFYLLVYLPNMIDSQVEHLRASKVEFRAICEDFFVYALVGFGPIRFELPFNPDRYDEKGLRNLSCSNMVTVVAVDSCSTHIRVLRYVSMPARLRNMYGRCWAAMLAGLITIEEYEAWIYRLTQYSLNALWKRATFVGAVGK